MALPSAQPQKAPKIPLSRVHKTERANGSRLCRRPAAATVNLPPFGVNVLPALPTYFEKPFLGCLRFQRHHLHMLTFKDESIVGNFRRGRFTFSISTSE